MRTPERDENTQNDPREALFGGPNENDWKWSKMTGTTGRGQNTGTTRRHFENDWTLFNLARIAHAKLRHLKPPKFACKRALPGNGIIVERGTLSHMQKI